jgi:hypothetical protein
LATSTGYQHYEHRAKAAHIASRMLTHVYLGDLGNTQYIVIGGNLEIGQELARRAWIIGMSKKEGS